MKHKLVMATNNANKLREVREILTPLGWEVLSQQEAGVHTEPEENGTTFEENAAIKARAVYALTGYPVLSDDSGLCVDALDGAPGVYSARYAPEGLLCETLLNNMEGIPDALRTAKFVTVAAFIDAEGELHCFRGECPGTIGYEKRGTNGFGYDPVFMYGGRSFAELSSEEKNVVSHRGKAMAELFEYLKNEKR